LKKGREKALAPPPFFSKGEVGRGFWLLERKANPTPTLPLKKGEGEKLLLLPLPRGRPLAPPPFFKGEAGRGSQLKML
jgi:hypothetical protein